MTDVDVVSGELVRYQSPAMPVPLSPDEARQKAQWVRDVTRAALIDGTDFGVIPGTGKKPTLLKPGAEMLMLAAGLGFTIAKVDDEDARTHQGVTYRCSVHRGGHVVAECEGYAGYDERRFANAGGWRADWNSVIKMAQKRALVGAALNAVAGSGLFTQDVEDIAEQPAVPAFDGLALMKPHLDRLDKGQMGELKGWRQANDLPAPSQMTAVQAAATLVEIGRIGRSDPAAAPDRMPVPDQGLPGEQSVGLVQGSAQAPASADIEGGEPFEPEATPAPPKARRELSAGEQVHRDLGRSGITKKQDQEDIIFCASSGRTVHASELTAEERTAAQFMGSDIAEGRITLASVVEANEAHRQQVLGDQLERSVAQAAGERAVADFDTKTAGAS